MNETLLELLEVMEKSYKGKYLEALLEGYEYFEDIALGELYGQWYEVTRDLLYKIKRIADKNEMFESSDEIQALLDNSK